MRTAILLIVALSLGAGCHKPKHNGFKSLGNGFAQMGKNIAAVAKKAVPIRVAVKTDLHADVAAIAKQQARQHADQRIAAIEPITLRKSVKHVDRGGDDRVVAAPAIEPTITRRTVDTGSEQVWKNTWRDGEKASCEKVATFDSCSATCGDILRGESMRQLSPNAGKPMQCECTQGYSKCQ